MRRISWTRKGSDISQIEEPAEPTVGNVLTAYGFASSVSIALGLRGSVERHGDSWVAVIARSGPGSDGASEPIRQDCWPLLSAIADLNASVHRSAGTLEADGRAAAVAEAVRLRSLFLDAAEAIKAVRVDPSRAPAADGLVKECQDAAVAASVAAETASARTWVAATNPDRSASVPESGRAPSHIRVLGPAVEPGGKSSVETFSNGA